MGDKPITELTPAERCALLADLGALIAADTGETVHAIDIDPKAAR